MNCLQTESLIVSIFAQLKMSTEPVAVPGFPRRVGVPTSEFGTKIYYFGNIFAENCMKMTEFGQGEHVASGPLDPPMGIRDFFPAFFIENTRNNKFLSAMLYT